MLSPPHSPRNDHSLQVASLIDAGERDVQRRSDAFLKHSSLSRKLEEARRQQEQEQWVEKERRKDYEQRLVKLASHARLSGGGATRSSAPFHSWFIFGRAMTRPP